MKKIILIFLLLLTVFAASCSASERPTETTTTEEYPLLSVSIIPVTEPVSNFVDKTTYKLIYVFQMPDGSVVTKEKDSLNTEFSTTYVPITFSTIEANPKIVQTNFERSISLDFYLTEEMYGRLYP